MVRQQANKKKERGKSAEKSVVKLRLSKEEQELLRTRPSINSKELLIKLDKWRQDSFLSQATV